MTEQKKRIMGEVTSSSTITESLAQKISQVKQSQYALHESDQQTNFKTLHITMFDDNQGMLDLYNDAAVTVNRTHPQSLRIRPILTTAAKQVPEELYQSDQPVDLILIDNNFTDNIPGKENFFAKDVLKALNDYNPPNLDANTPHKLKPRYLPRIVVTTYTYDAAVVEQLSVAGADRVIFRKGHETDPDPKEQNTAAGSLLNKLLHPDEWDDICQRACHRLWRDLLLFIETKIREQKTAPFSAQSAQTAMAALMNEVRNWLLDAGVAETVTFRIAERDTTSPDNPIMLRDVTHMHDHRLPAYKWDESPLLKELCEQGLWHLNRATMISRKLTKKDIPNDPLFLLKEPGCHGVGVPLTCGHGFFGTIALTRRRKTPWPVGKNPRDEQDNSDNDANRFTVLEAEYLVRMGQRLALYYEQLLDATRLRRRQQGLLELAEELAKQTSPEKMIRSTILFLHEEFHLNCELAYDKKYYDSPPGAEGKVACRLLEPASGLIYRPKNAILGYNTKQNSQKPKDHKSDPLTLESKNNIYVTAIREGRTVYCPNTENTDDNFEESLGPAKTAMVEPLTIQGRIIGALKVANMQADFYGPAPTNLGSGPSGNDNLDLLKSVANILAQALNKERLLRFEKALIQLATSTGPGDETGVMNNMAQALYAYIGPGVLLWFESKDGGELKISKGWCGQDPAELSAQFKHGKESSLIEMNTNTLKKWDDGHTDYSHLERTFRAYTTSLGEIDNYSEDPKIILAKEDKEKRNFPTVAQYSLVLVDNNTTGLDKRPQALGLLALVFRQKNAVPIEQKNAPLPDQIDLLRKFGSFIGTYLASVRRYQQFLGINQQRELAEFLLALSHQVRHTLKSKVNILVDNIENELDGGSGQYIQNPSFFLDTLKQWSEELSTTHLLPADLALVDTTPASCWKTVAAKLARKALSTGAQILPLESNEICICNRGILENAFFILLDNALDALTQQSDSPNFTGQVWSVISTNADQLIVDIYDNGPGFTQEIKNNFGELGLSTKSGKGSGTGLYWCKRFLPLANGKIELLASTPESRVRLTLQRKANEPS